MREKAREIEVEVLPPEGKNPGQDLASVLAWILDDLIRIPGTQFRLGLDPIVSMIPGIGDVSASALGTLIMLQAFFQGVPKIVIARMGLNIFINGLLGAVPGVGDLLSIWYKSNRRNYHLLQKHQGRRASTKGDWIFLISLVVIVLGGLFIIALVAGYLMYCTLKFLFGQL